MFTEAIENILADQCTPAAIRTIEGGGSPTALWNALAEAGFLELMTPEAKGGASLALDALFPICVAFGRHAVPVPAAQSIAARALLDGCATPPAGMITLSGAGRREENGTLGAPLTAFGMLADFALVNLDGDMLLLDCAKAERIGTGVHHSLCATLRWPKAALPAPLARRGEQVRRFSAAIHAAAIAGAMEWMFGKTLEYCNDRAQFGKAIGKFQAVQHQLSVMAEQVAVAGISAELAFSGGFAGTPDGTFTGAANIPALLPAAIAKARASMAVSLVAATAHALHGAIGVTEEFDLQLYSRRLHEWRMAEGSETYWNGIVGEAVLAQAPATVSPVASTIDFVRAALNHQPAQEQAQ
ncbi:MAG: acyl-CoA dehydrogenase family protein [Pseudomonadota bacterium]